MINMEEKNAINKSDLKVQKFLRKIFPNHTFFIAFLVMLLIGNIGLYLSLIAFYRVDISKHHIEFLLTLIFIIILVLIIFFIGNYFKFSKEYEKKKNEINSESMFFEDYNYDKINKEDMILKLIEQQKRYASEIHKDKSRIINKSAILFTTLLILIGIFGQYSELKESEQAQLGNEIKGAEISHNILWILLIIPMIGLFVVPLIIYDICYYLMIRCYKRIVEYKLNLIYIKNGIMLFDEQFLFENTYWKKEAKRFKEIYVVVALLLISIIYVGSLAYGLSFFLYEFYYSLYDLGIYFIVLFMLIPLIFAIYLVDIYETFHMIEEKVINCFIDLRKEMIIK